MRRILLSAIAVAFASSAFAADLPVKAHRAPIAAPAYNWTGFYAGANIGYGWASGAGTGNLNGVIGGGQVGYNWQGLGSPLVLGLEADIQGADQSRTDTILGVSVNQKIDYFGTVRARIGYAPGPWMIYATGGWGYGRYNVNLSLGAVSVSSSTSNSMWNIGGGVEWMFAPQWSVKAEYLYLDTGSVNATLFGVTANGRLRDNVARVGVNYHF